MAEGEVLDEWWEEDETAVDLVVTNEAEEGTTVVG